jgi:hypothetical protein
MEGLAHWVGASPYLDWARSWAVLVKSHKTPEGG